MARFTTQAPDGQAVLELEPLVRTALFKSGAQIVGSPAAGRRPD